MDEWRPVAHVDEPLAPENSSPRLFRFGERVRHVRDLVHWVGTGRIFTALVTIPLIGFGVFMLLRTPATPTENSIDYASTLPPSSVSPSNVGVRAVTSEVVSASNSIETIMVHVAGHVYSPGVYALETGERIVDAIRAAGGAQPIADLDAINLALALHDGDQVYVPAIGEVGLTSIAGRIGNSSTETTSPFPVNINTAEASMLEELPGIGPSTAAAIIGHRNKVGPFVSTSDLMDVPGIGSAKFEAIKDLVTV